MCVYLHKGECVCTLPVVVETEASFVGNEGSCNEYTVESPTRSPVHECMVPD